MRGREQKRHGAFGSHRRNRAALKAGQTSAGRQMALTTASHEHVVFRRAADRRAGGAVVAVIIVAERPSGAGGGATRASESQLSR